MNSSPSQPPSQLTPQDVGTPQSPNLPSPSLRSLPLCGAALWLFALSSLLFAAQPPELTVLRQQYDKAYAERVSAVFDASKASLDAKFTVALDNAITTAKASGDLPTVLAIQEDKKAIEAKQDLPADAETTPAALKNFRAIYREQVSKLTEQRTANTAALLAPYAAKLQQLEATLTKNDRVEEAKEVMDYRVSLKADAPAPQATMASTTPASTASPPSPATTQAPKVKGDDRKAAEWVLSVGGSVRLWDNSTGIVVYSADMLPKSKFSIRSINLDNNSGTIKPFTDTDFAALAGLERLDAVNIARTGITTAAFDTLATCPKLVNIMIQYNKLGDDLWAHLSKAPSLQKISQGYDGLPVTGVGISQLNRTLFTSLDLTGCPINDEALKEIATLDKLTQLNLDSSKVTNEGIKHLVTLKQLSYLNVRNTSVNVDGLMALKSLPLVRIGYGGNVQELAEQASQIAALFPGIENLSLPRDSDPSVVQWAAIANAWPKLKRLEINSRKFADAACEGLPQLTALLEMDSPYSPITDAGVAKIATLKKLFWLNLTEAKITDAALESLADMKPLKTLKLPKPGNGLTSEGIAKLKKKRPDIEVR